MPNVSSFGAQTDNSVVQGTVTDRAMIIPDIPPRGLMAVGPRVTPHFVKPSLWSALTTYHFFDAVHDAAGASYVAIKPEVPTGTELTDEEYWFLWADPNSQFAELSELVKTFDARIDAKAPINHASEETAYGVGNKVEYGHLKLADADTPQSSGPNEGIAATPIYVLTSLSYVTPEMFGATGDGVADDTSAVQSAMDSDKNVLLNNTYKVSSVTCAKQKSIEGAGSLNGTLYLGSTEEIVPRINVKDITIKGNVILNNYRSSQIQNVKFISTDYCIKRNANISIKRHHIGYFEISNCFIESDKGFLKLEKTTADEELPFNDISIFECTANTINDEFFYSDIQDGLKLYNNKIQYKSFGAAVKGNAIVINQGDFISIIGNTIFETGKSPIVLNLCNNTIISNNNIGWCGQQEICPAIALNKNQTLIPTHIVVANNSITYQSGSAIEAEKCRFVNVVGNSVKWSATPPYVGKPGCLDSLAGTSGSITYNNLYYSSICDNTLEGTSINQPTQEKNSERVIIKGNSGNANIYETTCVTTSNSTSSNLNVATSGAIILTPETPFSITQLNLYSEGQIIYIFNDSAQTITVTNNALMHLKNGESVQLGHNMAMTLIVHNGAAYQIS